MPKRKASGRPQNLPKTRLRIECEECGAHLGDLDANHTTILTELGRIRRAHAKMAH